MTPSRRTPSSTASDAVLVGVLRQESGRIVASLSRRFGDFDVAEEAVQQAIVEALSSWRTGGTPERPGAWLQVAATRNALDLVRASDRRSALARRAQPPAVSSEERAEGAGTDDRLPLIFACCHPTLAPEARVALTLRAVLGLTTPQISRAFLVSEATLAQRIVRAKRKIVTACIALSVPPSEQLPQRLPDVLQVIYVTYNEAYVSAAGATQDRDLGADATWLAEVVATELPGEPEAWGLAALLSLQHARSAGRFDASGRLVLLRDQDRTTWDRAGIVRAEDYLARAAALRRPGRYQLHAAIAACHATAESWEATDWLQIRLLYDALVGYDSSPVVRLNRSVAVAALNGPTAGLVEVDALSADLDGYHLFHATRAELLRGAGRPAEAALADARALSLTDNTAERRLLQTRLRRHALDDGT